jgi:hypothetical protein
MAARRGHGPRGSSSQTGVRKARAGREELNPTGLNRSSASSQAEARKTRTSRASQPGLLAH